MKFLKFTGFTVCYPEANVHLPSRDIYSLHQNEKTVIHYAIRCLQRKHKLINDRESESVLTKDNRSLLGTPN